MLEFIPAWVWAIILVLGVAGLIWKNKFSAMLGKLGSPVGLKTSTTLIVLSVIAILMGGWGTLSGYVGGLEFGTAGVQAPETVTDVTGELTVVLSAGVSNITTTEDYLNDAEDFMTFYSADASIADGEKYNFTATIEREYVSEDANVKVTCVCDDKELSGVTEDNLIEKTAGQIDLTFATGATSTGNHADDNTVWSYVSFAEGDGSQAITVSMDQEENYHDGMSDLDDYVDVECVAESGSNRADFTVRVLANS